MVAEIFGVIKYFTARGAPPPLARAPAFADSLSSRGAAGAYFTARGAPPPLARAPAFADSLSSRGAAGAYFTARGAPPPLARAPAFADSLSSRGAAGAYFTARGAPPPLARAPAFADSLSSRGAAGASYSCSRGSPMLAPRSALRSRITHSRIHPFSRLCPHVLKVHRTSLHASRRWRDVVGELADLVDRAVHDGQQIRFVAGAGQPFVAAARPFFLGNHAARRIKFVAGELADTAIEFAIGQGESIRQAVALENLVPAIDARLAVADVPVAQHFVHGIAHRDVRTLDRTVLDDFEIVHVLGDLVLVPLRLFRAAFQAVREIRRGVARDLVAVQIQAERKPEIDVALQHRQVDAAELRQVLGKS